MEVFSIIAEQPARVDSKKPQNTRLLCKCLVLHNNHHGIDQNVGRCLKFYLTHCEQTEQKSKSAFEAITLHTGLRQQAVQHFEILSNINHNIDVYKSDSPKKGIPSLLWLLS